jgi:hypothetical protein
MQKCRLIQSLGEAQLKLILSPDDRVHLTNDDSGTRILKTFISKLKALEDYVLNLKQRYRDLSNKIQTHVVNPAVKKTVLGHLRKEYHDRLMRNTAAPLKKSARPIVQCIIDLLFDKYKRDGNFDTDYCFHVAVRPLATIMPSFLCVVNIYELNCGDSISYNESLRICDSSLKYLEQKLKPAFDVLNSLSMFVDLYWVESEQMH